MCRCNGILYRTDGGTLPFVQCQSDEIADEIISLDPGFLPHPEFSGDSETLVNGSGTGFFVSKVGHMFTNFHVIRNLK